jgi:phosphoserine phosphatase
MNMLSLLPSLLLTIAQPPPAKALTECAVEKPTPPKRVGLGGAFWTSSERAQLSKLIETLGAGSASYDACRRPLAVLGLEGAVVTRDLGLLAFQAAAADALLPKSKEVIALMPEALRAPVEASWPEKGQPASTLFRAHLQKAQLSIQETGPPAEVRRWLSRLFQGTPSKHLEAMAEELIQTAEQAVDPESLETGEEALLLRWGLRVRPEMRQLIEALTLSGWDVAVVSSSAEWLARGLAKRLGLPKTQILGVRNRRDRKGQLTSEIREPLPHGAGKVLAMRTQVAPGGRVPTLVVGSGPADRDMLDQASRLGVLIDQGDQVELARHASARGWLVKQVRDSANAARR